MTDQITTPAELDALPAGAVLRDPLTNALLVVLADDQGRPVAIAMVHGASWGLSHGLTVLYRPDAPAPSAEDGHERGEPVYDDRQRYAETIARYVGWQPGVYEAAERLLVLAARQPAKCPACGRDDGRHKMSCRPQNRSDAARQPAPVDAETVLAAHQRRSNGMTYNTPDGCACGADVMPERGDEDPGVRRDRAFAAHQADTLAAAGLLATPEQQHNISVVEHAYARGLAKGTERTAEHDAQVAARALRDFATRCGGQAADADHGGAGFRQYASAWVDAATEARDEADRIERRSRKGDR